MPKTNQETRVKSSGSKLQFSQHSNGGLLAEKVSGQKAAESFCPAGEPLGLDDVTWEITVDRGWGGFCWGRVWGDDKTYLRFWENSFRIYINLTQIRNLASKFEKVYNAKRIVSLIFFGVCTSSIIWTSLKYFPSATWRIWLQKCLTVRFSNIHQSSLLAVGWNSEATSCFK